MKFKIIFFLLVIKLLEQIKGENIVQTIPTNITDGYVGKWSRRSIYNMTNHKLITENQGDLYYVFLRTTKISLILNKEPVHDKYEYIDGIFTLRDGYFFHNKKLDYRYDYIF
jgi:hypothetical protein